MWLQRPGCARPRIPCDVIVYGADNTSAVAALGGRGAVSGFPGWTYDLGIPDWSERWSASSAMLTRRAGHR